VPSAHQATQLCHIVLSLLPPVTFPSNSGRFQWWLSNSFWVCLFFFVLLLAPISSLVERNGCVPFYVRDPATLTDFFSRFLLLPIPVLCVTSSFVILCFQVIHKILLNHLRYTASSFLLFVTVMYYVSLPYFGFVNTSDSCKQSFFFNLRLLLFQTFESLPFHSPSSILY